MHSTLPQGTSPDLALVQPTPQELQLVLDKSADEWRGALPGPEAYARRERHLSSQLLCKAGGQTWWVLVDTSLPAEQRQVLSSCSTLRKRALVRHRDMTREAFCHVVGDVFCPREFRKRGYGQRMMQELSKRLQTWQSEEGLPQFSALYSDIGKRFYHDNGGWVAFPSAHVHLPARTTADESESVPVRLLAASQLHSLCVLDEQLLRRNMDRRRCSGDEVIVAMVPEQRVMEWHHAREEFVAGEVLGRVPEIKGALTQTGSGRLVWCIWTRMYYNTDMTRREDNTLHILRMAAEEVERGDDDGSDGPEGEEELRDAMARLLAAAQHQAHEWMCSAVELWNPGAVALAAARCLDAEASVVHREHDGIAALAWYGGSSQPVTWLHNEKYGWS